LTNLLSNAVKFSPQGGVVSFDLVGQPGQAIFRIRDEGIGIPTEERERLFELFYRASNVGTIQGTGLGLAIAKKCVDLHQGQITVDSEVGVGTTFTVTLPLNLMPSLEERF
jgi:signal transduction histidine kinase